MLKKLRESFLRKKARRKFQEYGTDVERFDVGHHGTMEFANWKNPLIGKTIPTEHTISFFKRFLKAGDMAIDIGANIGGMSVPMGWAVGPTGLVVSFDPNPVVFKVLEKNASLNQDQVQIKPYNFAITAEAAEFFYYSSEASFGNGGLSLVETTKHGKFKLDQKVKGVNLEAFLSENHAGDLSRLRLVKIDTEGYDKEIIRQIAPLLKKIRPILIAECFKYLRPEEKEELYAVVAAQGYRLFYFEDFNDQAEEFELTRESMQRKETFNFFALPS